MEIDPALYYIHANRNLFDYTNYSCADYDYDDCFFNDNSSSYYSDFCSSIKLAELFLYYVPALGVVGLVGNLLALTVFTTTNLKYRSSSYYLAALSCADFLFDVTLLLVNFTYLNWIDIFNQEGWCQFLVYISGLCNALSVWVIVAFTIERYIAVEYPLQRPNICTVARAKLITTILVVIACVSHTYVFATAGLVTNDSGEVICGLLKDKMEIMKIVNFVDFFATLAIPFVLIVAMNTLIIKNLYNFKGSRGTSLTKFVLSKASNSGSSRINTNSSLRSSSNCKKFNIQTGKCSCQEFKSRPVLRPTSVVSTQHNITKMLVITSSVFLLLNSPSYFFRMYIFMQGLLKMNETITETLWCSQQLSMLFYYTNYSMNFLLYTMCGTTFRRCLVQIMKNFFKRLYSYVTLRKK